MSRIATFVDETIDSMLRRPKLWGSPRCVEGQLMRLLEVRAVASDPHASFRVAGDVQRAYLAFMRSELPGSTDASLFTRVDENEGRYRSLLERFCTQIRDEQDCFEPSKGGAETPRYEVLLDAAQVGPVGLLPRGESEAA